MKKLELSSVRKKFRQYVNKDTCVFVHAINAVTGRFVDIIDFDVYLPTKEKNLQRPLVWTQLQKEQLILSILKDIRIPAITVVVREHKFYKIIDGKQRLSTLMSFIRGEFSIHYNGENYFIQDLDEWAGYAVNHYAVIGDIYYEYDDMLMTDDELIDLYEMINFVGTPQDIEHLNNLKS